MKPSYHDALKSFDSVRMDLLTVLQELPKSKRTLKISGEWTLKEILVHLTEWDLYTSEIIDDLVDGTEPRHFGNVDDFNKVSIVDSESLGWDEAYANFVEAGGVFIDTYENLADKYWEKKFWKDKKSTPLKYLGIETKHYMEHLEEIKNLAE